MTVDEKLDQILESLSAIVRLLVPEPRATELDLKGEQKVVYELCDSTRSIAEIADEIGKPAPQIRKTLTRLREKKFVSSTQKSGNIVYFRVPSNVQTSDES
jgi:DNA-binding transcriptional ArsR family regulator